MRISSSWFSLAAAGKIVVPVVSMAFLTGCHTYGSSETIKSLPSDLTKVAVISDIEVKSLPPDASPEFREKVGDGVGELGIGRVELPQHFLLAELPQALH